MFTARFWALAGERAIGAASGTAVSLLGVAGIGLLNAPWQAVASAAGMAGLLSVLKGLAATQVGDPTSPALLNPPPQR